MDRRDRFVARAAPNTRFPNPKHCTPSTEVDLWKFFEARASELKESMFKMVTWIIGFAAVLLGFAVKEGFEKGLASVAHPRLLMSVGVVGLVIVGHAVICCG